MLEFLRACFADYEYQPADARFTGQDANEKVLLLLRRHWITNLGWLLTAILLILMPFIVPILTIALGFDVTRFGLPASYVFMLTVFWYLITATFIFESYLNWYSNVYIVSNKKIIDVDFYGILHVSVTQAPVSNVEDVTYSTRGIYQTVLDFGQVLIQTAGEKENLEFDQVPKPAHVQDVVSDLVTEARNVVPKQ